MAMADSNVFFGDFSYKANTGLIRHNNLLATPFFSLAGDARTTASSRVPSNIGQTVERPIDPNMGN